MADKKTENRSIDTAKARGELEEDLLEYVYRKWRQGRQITSKEYARTTGITTSEVLFLYKIVSTFSISSYNFSNCRYILIL